MAADLPTPADLAQLAEHAESLLHRALPHKRDRNYVDGVHDGIAFALGWTDPPELPEPLPECAVCRDQPPVGRRCPSCREWS